MAKLLRDGKCVSSLNKLSPWSFHLSTVKLKLVYHDMDFLGLYITLTFGQSEDGDNPLPLALRSLRFRSVSQILFSS